MRRLRSTVDQFGWSDVVQCNANDRAAWTELKWAHASGTYIAAEIKRQGRIIANDFGDESTTAVTLLVACVGVQRQWGQSPLECFPARRQPSWQNLRGYSDSQRSEPQIL